MQPSNPNAGSSTGQNPQSQQFGRTITLLVSNSAGQALDLSQLRIKFNVKKTGIMTPNQADIIVYNISAAVEELIQSEFTHVILNGGYVGNFGLIFKGNIKQCITGRENGTDTYLELICGDGDIAFQYATINQTLKGGSFVEDQYNLGLTSLAKQGVGQGFLGPLPKTQLPRGKVVYGNARDHLQKLVQTYGFAWSIQDGNLVFLSQGQTLPNQAIVLTSKTGLIGTPQQLSGNEGFAIKSLLNPNIKVHSRIHVNNASIAAMKIDFWTPGSPANTPASPRWDGLYYPYIVEMEGDTRGQDWYSNLKCLSVDVATNALDSVVGGRSF